MAAGRIVLSQYFPARDRNGFLVGGAKLFVYANKTTTKAPIYSNAGLTTPLTNPVVANSSGQFPSIWADDASLYTLSITGPTGTSIGNPSVFDDFSVSVDAMTESVSLAEAAAEAAEAYYDDVLALSGTYPDPTALATRAAKAANLSDLADKEAATANLLFRAAGTGAVDQTVRDKLRQYVNLLDCLTDAERADALSGNPVIDTTAKVNAFLAANTYVEITKGMFFVDYINHPATLLALRGFSRDSATFKRRPGSDGAFYRASSPRVTFAEVSNIYLLGNNEVGETCGVDLTSFSYCTFTNIRVRNFKQDGFYAKGLITPTVLQMSNNALINCIAKDNGRDGFHAVGDNPLRYENTANVVIGGEFSANGRWGIYGDVCEATHFYGVTAQANWGIVPNSGDAVTGTPSGYTPFGDIYFNSRFCIFYGYVESLEQSIVMGPLSKGCDVKVRSSYPLWNTFIDEGIGNQLSVMGEEELERHLFNNPYFTDWTTAVPAGMALLGAPAVASYADTLSPFGAGLELTFGGNFQGIEIPMVYPVDDLEGRYVTLIVEMDTAGVVDPIEMRLYTYDGASLNTENGTNVIIPVPETDGFDTFTWDVKFADVLTAPSLRWYLSYGGNSAGGNDIRFRSARVVLGQTRQAGWPLVDLAKPASATAAQIGGATNGINIHRKRVGSLVYDTTNAKLRYAEGTGPTALWRATDASGAITPA